MKISIVEQRKSNTGNTVLDVLFVFNWFERFISGNPRAATTTVYLSDRSWHYSNSGIRIDSDITSKLDKLLDFKEVVQLPSARRIR